MARVLVVDDSRGIRLAINGILKSLGVVVSEAGNGQEALDSVASEGIPNAVLLDWNMPVMNGIEFLQKFRADVDKTECPVIMVTTNNDFANITEALSEGADEYIMKPFDKDMILGKLEALGVQV